jgi:hypothetical protein
MKKNFYLWHRRLGIMACAFVFVWSLSGFLHPIMSWTQPRPVKMSYQGTPLAEMKFGLSPVAALKLHGIADFGSFGVASFGGKSFYQIETNRHASLVYLDTETGEKLENGDEKYAEHLARYFTGDQTSPISKIKRITDFGGNYTFQNRFLPVYEVEFVRADKMAAYIETSSSRVATLVDRRKATIQWIFTNMHNFGWAGLGEPYRSLLLVCFMLITFSAAASGFFVYLLFWKKFKSETNGNSRSFLRKYHRSIGIVVALVVMMMSFSGGFHAFEKRTPDDRHLFATENTFSTGDLSIPLPEVLAKTSAETVNVSLIKIAERPFYRLTNKQNEAVYIDSSTGAIEPNGELKYSRSLANLFSGMSDAEIVSVQTISAFTGEYGFINKRLPIAKVQYDRPGNIRYYVETSTGRLGARIEDSNLYEGYTFSYLHKWQFLNFLGNIPRDLVIMSFAALNIIVALLGLCLFVLSNKKRFKVS